MEKMIMFTQDEVRQLVSIAVDVLKLKDDDSYIYSGSMEHSGAFTFNAEKIKAIQKKAKEVIPNVSAEWLEDFESKSIVLNKHF